MKVIRLIDKVFDVGIGVTLCVYSFWFFGVGLFGFPEPGKGAERVALGWACYITAMAKFGKFHV